MNTPKPQPAKNKEAVQKLIERLKAEKEKGKSR